MSSPTEPTGYPQQPPPPAPIPVTLSTASVFPETVDVGFALAAECGYDGVEVMVTADQRSQRPEALRDLMSRFGVPILSIHSPCLLISTRVWGVDALVKTSRSVELAERVGARVVVVHPPFVWQRAAAADFSGAIAELQQRTSVRIAVENMFPMTVGRGRFAVNGYRPHWNPVPYGHRWFTLDLSHTAASGVDALDMADQMGAGLGHVHLADGLGVGGDEHLVPGRGSQPCAELLESLSRRRFDGAVCLEINTRGKKHKARVNDVREAAAFSRLHLGQSPR